jgi:hypothetical protein
VYAKRSVSVDKSSKFAFTVFGPSAMPKLVRSQWPTGVFRC